MNIVGALHFFSAAVCICWGFCLPLRVSDICGIWSDSIKSPCQARDWMRNVKWNSGNLFKFDAYQLHMPTCLPACMVLFFSVSLHAIHLKEFEKPNQQVHQNWFPFDRDWKTSTRLTFVDLHSHLHSHRLLAVSFSHPFSRLLPCCLAISMAFKSELMCKIKILLHSKTWFSLIMSAHKKILIRYFHQSEFSKPNGTYATKSLKSF